MNPYTYSFVDTHVGMVGPGVSVSLGSGAGDAEEGISVEPASDVDVPTIGVDGVGMHSLVVNYSGKITVRLLKTSPINQILAEALAFQRVSAANWGQNTISIKNSVSGDSITCQQCAFGKPPNINYAKEGGMVEWEFNSLHLDLSLGAGVTA